MESMECYQDGSWDVNVGQSGSGPWHIKFAYASLPGKKPYLINLAQVECVVGEWNKDKTQYGVRIFYTSGNSVWVGETAAKSLFQDVWCSDSADSIFDRAKREG